MKVQHTGGPWVDVERLDAHVRRWRVACRLSARIFSAATRRHSSNSRRSRRAVHVETKAGMRRKDFALKPNTTQRVKFRNETASQ